MKDFIRNPSRVDKIQVLDARGPWQTKSGGKLMVAFTLPFDVVQQRYFAYDQEELKKVPEDIRGLRIYTVRDLPQGPIGGTEFHRIREEIIYGLEGKIKMECEDLFGGKKKFILTPEKGIWMPPFILHTYKMMEEKSGLLVIANTLFNPDDPRTHDTYSLEVFRQLQKDNSK